MNNLEKMLSNFNTANDFLKSTSGKFTLKAGNAFLSTFSAEFMGRPDFDFSKHRTKESFIEFLTLLVSTLRQEYQAAYDAAEAEAKTNRTTYLDELADEIGTCLESMQSNSQRIGELLLKAREEFAAQNKKTEFLPWCFAHFYFTKAHTYKLMRVAEFLRDDKRFTGVAMRVLHSLISNGTPEVIEKAAELAANGSLNSGTLAALIEPKQEPAPKPEPSPEPTPEAEASLATVPNAGTSVQGESGPDDVPSDMGDTPPVSTGPVYIEQAQAEVAELKQQLSDALAEIRRLTTPAMVKQVQAAPMLRQFKTNDPRCVLGLTSGEAKDKQAIKTAFREFIKLGYGEGHEAYPMLAKAQEILLLELI